MNNEAESSSNPDIAKIGKLLRGIRTAMLTTEDDDGNLHARPMATQEASFDGTLWFFTREPSAKTEELEESQQVNVSYLDEHKATYVSLAGRGFVVHDKAKMKELWTPLLQSWFPQGIDDPELALLKVEVDTAQYWDAPSSKLVRLIGLAKAALTRTPYKAGDTGTVDLHS